MKEICPTVPNLNEKYPVLGNILKMVQLRAKTYKIHPNWNIFFVIRGLLKILYLQNWASYNHFEFKIQMVVACLIFELHPSNFQNYTLYVNKLRFNYISLSQQCPVFLSFLGHYSYIEFQERSLRSKSKEIVGQSRASWANIKILTLVPRQKP